MKSLFWVLAVFVALAIFYTEAFPFVSSENDPLTQNDDVTLTNDRESLSPRNFIQNTVMKVVLPAYKIVKVLKEKIA
uniref:Venom peptide Ld5a n=1 Tax=Lethocerus distinctifemur TaxID=280095 RepID=A0A2K8JLF1_9HEMI|nr:venom peptide Ld5a [Lethocerus distinctifemur]